MTKKFYYMFSFGLLLCTQQTIAQTTPKDTTVPAKTMYNEAGFVKRLMLGEHYRKEWAAPVTLKMLDLDSVAGGLTPIKTGGGHQTKSLRLRGGDGREYVLRQVNKDPSKAMPAEFAGSFAEDVVQDQISSSNPYAPVAVAALAEAAGIFHTTPRIVFLPASPRLDTFMNAFANTVCLFEERPAGNEGSNAAVGYSTNVINSQKLFEKLLTDDTQHVDQKAFLKARLFDMWIGDWDRHEDQWLWAAFREDGQTIYRPIPRDRDQAFAKLDGILPAMAQKPWMIRKTKNFDYAIRDVAGLNMGATFLDRNFLDALSLKDWTEVAEALQENLTDEKIEEALRLLPKNIYEISGPEIIAKLKSRRDGLQKYAKEYYYFLSREVSVTGTLQEEVFDVKRLNDDATAVTIFTVDAQKKASQIVYSRAFSRKETKEVRLFGFGGDDVFNISGDVNKSILIRIVGGNGKDSTIDNSVVRAAGRKTRVYDNDESTYAKGDEATKMISLDTLKNKYTKGLLRYDWFSPKFSLGYNPDDGIYAGGGIIIKKQQFGKAPYGYMQSFWGNYAIATGSYNFWYEGIFKEAVGKWDLHLNAIVNAPNYVLNYYGKGNETIKYENVKDYYRVRANEWMIVPSLNKQISRHQSITIGLNYQTVKVERSDNRFITDAVAKLDSSIFSRKHFAGMRVNYELNTTDNALYPRQGVKLNSGVEFINNIKESDVYFARISSDASFYVSHKSLTAAFRMGAATNVGNDYEFYQSNTLGGSTNLRGFGRTRFAGKTALYQNTELRYKFRDMNGYFLRGNWGLIGFFDHGRVWVPDETSNAWHFGYGGGIWFLPYNKIAFTATYGLSREDKLLNVKAGFFF